MAKRPYEYGARVAAIFEGVSKHDIFTAWLEDLITRGEEDGLDGDICAQYIADRANMVRNQRQATRPRTRRRERALASEAAHG